MNASAGSASESDKKFRHRPFSVVGIAENQLRTRIITAIIGIPVVLLAILLGLPGIAVLSISAGIIGGIELDRMMRPTIDRHMRNRSGVIGRPRLLS